MKHYKKYPNRRLYDIDASTYVTVDDIRAAITDGESLSVVDSKTGKDLTRTVLLQVISEQEGEGHQPILTNRVLGSLASACPRDEDELLAISGIGEKLADKYGEDLLRIVAEKGPKR